MQAPGSAVTLVSAQQKLARKGLLGSSQHPHAFKGQRLVNLFSHKFTVKLNQKFRVKPGFTSELPALAGELNQALGPEMGSSSALKGFWILPESAETESDLGS